MVSLFAEAWSDASADIDAEFGESLVLIPTAAMAGAGGIADPNARSSLSPVRQPLPFIGIFFDKGAVMHAQGRSMADSTTRPVVAEKPMIDVDRAQFAEDPVEGDIVQRVDPVAVYKITRFVVDDLNRAWMHLAERRSASGLVR